MLLFLKKEGFVVKSEVKDCDATARCVFPKYDKNSRRNRNFYGQRGSKQKKRSFVKRIDMLLFLKKEGFVVKSEVKDCDATARCVFPKYDKNSRRNRNFYGQRGSKQKKRSFVKRIDMLLFLKKEGFVVKSEVKGCDVTAQCAFQK